MSSHELFRSRMTQSMPTTQSQPTLRDTRKRRPRHTGIFQAVQSLDTQLDEATRREVARWIGEQYVTEYGSALLGMVGVCYLGPPYADHRLDLLGGIIDHFAASEPMPAPYEAARMLARSGAYAFVEVHSDGRIVPVADDGTPS